MGPWAFLTNPACADACSYNCTVRHFKSSYSPHNLFTNAVTAKRGPKAALQKHQKHKFSACFYLPAAPSAIFLRSITLATASARPPSEVSL